MIGVLISTGFIGVVALSVWLLIKSEDRSIYFIPLAIVWILILGVFINLGIQQNTVGPCLRYETGYSYNAATKTMMPYRNCVERGEWVYDQ